MTAEIRKPDVTALRLVMLHRRSDIFSRIEAEPSVVFCFQAFILTRHSFHLRGLRRNRIVAALPSFCRQIKMDHTESMIIAVP